MPKTRTEYNKTYYDKSYDKIIINLKKTVSCSICDCEVKNSAMCAHRKTKKHQLNLQIHDLKNKFDSNVEN